MAVTKPKRGRGRPRNPDRPQLEKDVAACIRKGLTFADACIVSGVPRSTAQRWRDDPEFAAMEKEARAWRKLTLLDKIEKTKTGWQRFAWILERTEPQEFGRRIEAQVSQEETTLLRIEVIDAPDHDG